MSGGINATTFKYGKSYRSMTLRGFTEFTIELVPPRIQKFRRITHFVKSRKVMGMRKVQQPRIRTAMLLAGISYTPRALRAGRVCLIGVDERSRSSSSEEAESCSSRATSSGSSSSSEDDETTDPESDPSSPMSCDCPECAGSRPEKRLIGEEGSCSPSCLCRRGSGEIACGMVLRWRAQIS